jgi:hypothetical protein
LNSTTNKRFGKFKRVTAPQEEILANVKDLKESDHEEDEDFKNTGLSRRVSPTNKGNANL